MITIKGLDVFIISVIVLFLGRTLTNHVTTLKRFNIPPAVTGGLIASLITAAIYYFFDQKISFNMRLRDILLLLFFSTVGLNAKISVLKQGGKTLVQLVGLAFVFLMLQDALGVFLAYLSGNDPAYGLFAGSISLAGGHGTAIAWGSLAKDAGLVHAEGFGIACATFGLIAGGLLGGPVAERFITKYQLKPKANQQTENNQAKQSTVYDFDTVVTTLLMLAICVEIGDLVNRSLFAKDIVVPGFLTAMMVGIVLTNALDLFKKPLNTSLITTLGDYCLQFFLAMSLMAMQLWTLADSLGSLLVIISLQSLLMTVFAAMIVFRVLGRDYDASVISAGFVGLGLGSTPVAIANMGSVTERYGPSLKAFLVIPIVGAFFIDILNAFVIQQFLRWLH